MVFLSCVPGWTAQLPTFPSENISGKLAHRKLHSQTHPCGKQDQQDFLHNESYF